jgi:hypothetical protein
VRNAQARRWAALGIAGLQLIASTHFYVRYRGLAYPRDVLYKHEITLDAVPTARRILETPTRYGVVAPPRFRAERPRYAPDRLVLVNFGYLYQSGPGDYVRYGPSASARVIADAPHFLSFEPYLFEGFDAKWRAIMLERKSRVRVLLADTASTT